MRGLVRRWRRASGAGPAEQAVLDLQRQVGNLAVSRLLGAEPAVPEVITVQRHDSWEHRLLGDATPAEMRAMTDRAEPANRRHVLRAELDRIGIWQQNPLGVTVKMVQRTWPHVRVLTLRNGLVLTYGELNTLPDYMANPEAIDSAPKELVLSLLQTVRQQGYDRIADLLGEEHLPFEGAVGPRGSTGTMAAARELLALNRLTKDLGPDQYQSLVARNACHFAPFNWNRWEQFHLEARDLAARSWTDRAGREELIRQAWLNNGYADHFLQDAFASGHLVNKTVIMQWFVEWVQEQQHSGHPLGITLEDWGDLEQMTTHEQPGIGGSHLYHGDELAREHRERLKIVGMGTLGQSPGHSTDPQTAEEGLVLEERMRLSGVRAAPGRSQGQSYQAYLSFLNSVVLQKASGEIHDYLNEASLFVASPARPEGYQIFGDGSALQSSDGATFASEAAHQSQDAIDLLTRGRAAPDVGQIRALFPDRVLWEGQQLSLEAWHQEGALRDFCFGHIFPKVSVRLFSQPGLSHMGKVSQDVGGTRD